MSTPSCPCQSYNDYPLLVPYEDAVHMQACIFSVPAPFTLPFVPLQAKSNRGASGSVASKAKKGNNPLSGVGTGLPQVGEAKKKASKATSVVSKKANKTASKAASKVCPLHLHLSKAAELFALALALLHAS